MWDNELMLQRQLAERSSQELRAMLQDETEKAIPDDDLVLSILHILEDREPDVSMTGTAREEAAWKLFRKRIRARKKRGLLHNPKLLKAASVILVLSLLFVMVPRQAEADNWWQRLTKWTDEFFGFFREEETFPAETYVFETDNPGLQQVYDAVVDMGVTIPVVPMWLPEGYVLEECTTVATPVKQYIYARFLNEDKECTLQINVLNAEERKFYFKNNADVQAHEKGGTIHSLVQNQDAWIASWTKDNIECSIFIDCSKDILHGIIDSIYKGRMNE